MMRYLKCFVAVVIAAACAAAYAAESGGAVATKATVAEMAKLLPDGAAVIVAGRSIDECVGGLSSFAASIEPRAAMMINSQMLLRQFAVDTGDGGGVDTAGAMGLALTFRPDDEPSAITFVPLADVQAWRAGWGDSIKKDEGEAFEYVEGMYGDRNYFTVKNGFAVFAETSEEIDGWSKGLETPLSQARKQSFEKALEEMPLAVVVSMGAIKTAYPDMITDLEGKMEEAFASAPQSAGVQGKVLAKLLVRVAGDFFDSVDGAVAGMNPTEDGLTVSVEVMTVAGSVYSGILAEQGKADLSDLRLMPAGAALAGAGGWRGDKGWQYVTDIAVEVSQAIAEDQEKAAELKDKIIKAVAQMKESGLAESSAFALLPGGEGKMFSTVGVYNSKDAAKGLDAMMAVITDMKDVMVANNFGGMKIADIEITDGEVGGTPVKIMTQTLDLSEAEPEQKKIFEAMYGDSITSYMAAKDGKVYFAQMDDGTLLADLMSGKGGADMEKISRTLQKVGSDASGVVFISLPNYMIFVSNMMSAAMNGAGPTLFDVPETSVYTAMSAKFSQAGAKGMFYLPVEEMLAAKAVFQQAMSQSAGMGFDEDEESSTESDLEEEVIIEDDAPMESGDSTEAAPE